MMVQTHSAAQSTKCVRSHPSRAASCSLVLRSRWRRTPKLDVSVCSCSRDTFCCCCRSASLASGCKHTMGGSGKLLVSYGVHCVWFMGSASQHVFIFEEECITPMHQH